MVDIVLCRERIFHASGRDIEKLRGDLDPTIRDLVVRVEDIVDILLLADLDRVTLKRRVSAYGAEL